MSMISAMPPTDLMLKHENQSPHSLSNLSSPTTNGAGHSPSNSNNQPQSSSINPTQAIGQGLPPTTAAASAGGRGGGTGGFNYFGGVSPTEGSTASDSSQTGSGNGMASGAGPTISAAAGMGGPQSSSDDDFGLGFGGGGGGAGVGGGGPGMSNGGPQAMPFQQQYPNSVNINNNGMNMPCPSSSSAAQFNMPSPLKAQQQQQFNCHQQQQQQMFIAQQQEQQQMQHQYFAAQQHHHNQQQQQHQQMSGSATNTPTNMGNTPPQFGNPMSHPGFFNHHQQQQTPPAGQTLNIKSPFEEEENCRPLSHPGSMPQRIHNSKFDYCHQTPIIPANPFFDQHRQLMCQKVYPIHPGNCPPGLLEKFPYVFHSKQRLPVPYPVPVAHTHMSSMIRMPQFVMGPNGPIPISAAMASKCSPGQFPGGPPHPGFPMSMGGYPPHLMPPNGQMPPPGMGQQRAGGAEAAATTKAAAKQSAAAKKKEKAATKKKEMAAAQAAAQAQAQVQMGGGMGMMSGPHQFPHPGMMGMGGGGPGCSMPGMMMPQPDSSSAAQFAQMKAEKGRMAAMNGNSPSPQFKVSVCSPPLQRPNKLIPSRPEYRLPESGDCACCRNKITPMNKGIRCTAINQGCGLAFHFECANLSNGNYFEFLRDPRLEWICEKCNKMKPYSSFSM